MNLTIIEHHPQRVLEAFRRGEFDHIEIIGEADEKEFFELCFKEKILEALVQTMPSAKKKEEVPSWFILAANLSLKLHLEKSFYAFETVVRCGGLLSALPPGLASKHLDPQTQRLLICCQGFNDKNTYDRTTPCDQDTLRKAFKGVAATRWQQWYNAEVQEVYQGYGFFDPTGIFVGDGTYLFVPDNEAYEGSVVMWFDEHNHPVDYEKLTPKERKQARRRRCYKMVSLLHLRGQSFVYAAVAVVPGNTHESPVLYELVEQFVQRVGKGVMKKLILDRGFIDGRRISHCHQQLGVTVLIPMKKKMDIWDDAWALGKTEPWLDVPVPPSMPRSVPANRPPQLVRRESKRQQTLADRKAQEPSPPPAQQWQRTQACPIKGFTSWAEATVPMHVLLLRDTYADGHQEDWGLMTTADFIDPFEPMRDYALRTSIEERHRLLKCFYDLSDFRSRTFNAIVAQVVFVLLSYTLRQWQLWKLLQTQIAGVTPAHMKNALSIRREYVVIHHQSAYTQMPLVVLARELLELTGSAREKALRKLRELEQSMLCPLQNLRPP
jgi:hypothetical protein